MAIETEKMLLTLEDIKGRLGILPTDTTFDEALTTAAPQVTEWFETYCLRGLAEQVDAVEVLYAAPRLGLFRYPITEITSVAFGVTEVYPASYQVVESSGQIITGWANSLSQVTVTYTGGYPQDAVPPDLAQSYARCCGDVAGVPASGVNVTGSAPLKSLGLGSGALVVSFDNGTAAAAYDTSDSPALLDPYVFTLRRYRNQGA
jgi:hypothetical protein